MNDIVGRFLCGLGVYCFLFISFYAFGFEYLFDTYGVIIFFVGIISAYIGNFIWNVFFKNIFL